MLAGNVIEENNDVMKANEEGAYQARRSIGISEISMKASEKASAKYQKKSGIRSEEKEIEKEIEK